MTNNKVEVDFVRWAELEHASEEHHCTNMWLDDMKAPTHDESGKKYSTVGRITQLLNNFIVYNRI